MDGWMDGWQGMSVNIDLWDGCVYAQFTNHTSQYKQYIQYIYI